MARKKIVFLALGLTALIVAIVIIPIFAFTDTGFGMSGALKELIPQVMDRENTYRALIGEANARIDSLNTQLALEQEQNASDILSPETAMLVSRNITPQEFTMDGLPALVEYAGVPAYEIKFLQGTLVLDANTGEVLFSNLPEKITSDRAITIAAEYLKVYDTGSAVVSLAVLDGANVFKVQLGSYIVYIDQFGSIVKAQQIQYVSPVSNASSNTQSNYRDDDHDDDHDDYEYEDD